MHVNLSTNPAHGSTDIDILIPRGKSIETELIRDKLLMILLAGGEVLPPSSSPLGRLWKVVSDNSGRLEDCVEIIKSEPALAARIFRFANSVLNAGRSGAMSTSLDDAVMRIGYAQVRELVFSSGVLNQFSKLTLPPGWERFWFRNLLVARLTERISSKFFRTNGTEYLAGLLHDSGLAFVASFFPAEFERIFSGEHFYLKTERTVLPACHSVISAAVCARSRLPLRVVNAVIYHHNPIMVGSLVLGSASQSAQFLSIVLNVADKIADYCGVPIGTTPIMTLEEVTQTPEALWLRGYGELNYAEIVSEELKSVDETFAIFWPDLGK